MPAAPSIAPITATPLTADAFRPFGDVVEMPDGGGHLINEGTARRVDDVASLDLTADSGRPQLSLYRVAPGFLPFEVRMLERHPMSSQTFLPLAERRFLVIVAPAGPVPKVAEMRAFLTDGRQGVSYARGVWHHPVVAFAAEADVAVIGRAGPDENRDVHRFSAAIAVRFDTAWSD